MKKRWQILLMLLAATAGKGRAGDASSAATSAQGSFCLCMNYSHDGGCSQTSEHVTWRAWLRLDINSAGRVSLRLVARGQEIHVPWGHAGDSSSIEHLTELSWSGRVEQADRRLKIELEPPSGHCWERMHSRGKNFLPRDWRPEAGMTLDCELSSGKSGRRLLCTAPPSDKQPIGHLARQAYYLVQDGRIDLPAAPGELRTSFEDSLHIRGVLPGEKAGETKNPAHSLAEALASARVSPAGTDEHKAREAEQLLVVCDPDGEAPERARQWLRSPAPSETGEVAPKKSSVNRKR